MATSPSYASVPLAPDIITISTANPNRDGSGTIASLTTGTTNGVVTEQIRVTAQGNTTAGMIRFFLSKDGGATKVLLLEQVVPPNVAGASASAWSATIDALTGMTLQGTNTILYVATNNAEAFNVFHHKAGL
jgi:hypothetical protein